MKEEVDLEARRGVDYQSEVSKNDETKKRVMYMMKMKWMMGSDVNHDHVIYCLYNYTGDNNPSTVC